MGSVLPMVGCTVGRALGSAAGMSMAWGTAVWLPAWGTACVTTVVFAWGSSEALVPSVLVLGLSCPPVQHSGCDYCMCTMFVPWLGLYLVGGNNHIYCSGLELLGYWHGWKMLKRPLQWWMWSQLVPVLLPFGTAHTRIQAVCTGIARIGRWAGTGPVGRSSLWPHVIRLHVIGPWF